MRKLFPILIIIVLIACDKNDNFVVFSTENDIQLGQQVKAQIASDPSIKILSTTEYPEVYNFLYHAKAQSIGCDTDLAPSTGYEAVKASLDIAS